MKNALLPLGFLFGTLLVCAQQPPPGTQHWEAKTGVGFAPWTFDLRIEGGTVTGVIGQARTDPPTSTVTTLIGPFEIYDGKAAGNNIEFKAKTPDGLRIITFQGVRNGDSISFKRSVQVISGVPGQNGILGGAGATEFVATLDGSVAPAVSTNPRPNTAPAPAATGPSGRWQTTGIPSAPWTFEFTATQSSLTGTVQQMVAPSGKVSIAAGTIDGTTISFKILSPDAERIIAFTGRVNGNQISFVREITPLPGRSRGGVDLYGGGAPLQFVASRVAAGK
jgi:hypothetical protein